jgi:hypothetical protein
MIVDFNLGSFLDSKGITDKSQNAMVMFARKNNDDKNLIVIALVVHNNRGKKHLTAFSL